MLEQRTLGRTGLQVSVLALGCGPIAELMTGDDPARQVTLLQHALDCGVNWIDTAAGYGQGKSECSVGEALRQTTARQPVHVATKVRLRPEQLDDIPGAVRQSLEESLQRLQLSQVTLLQLHNAITTRRGDQPTSLTVADVLGQQGVLPAFRSLQQEGLVQWIGLTGIGHADALHRVVESGEFDTLQVPYNLLNPSAGQHVSENFPEVDYGNMIARAQQQNLGVFVIRVYAAGALLGQPPGAYTRSSPYFTLDLYERDLQRVARLQDLLPAEITLQDAALRFALGHPGVSSAILGLSEPAHVDDALQSLSRGPLPPDLLQDFTKI